MIEDIKRDVEQRMQKSIETLVGLFNKIRTGRATPAILDVVRVSYYGVDTPLSQVANVIVEDARTLLISPWEKKLVPEIEKAIYRSDLGLNPNTTSDVIRVPMPPLTEETRKTYIKQARQEAENARVAIRNVRRDANGMIKDLLKEKEISEDDQRRAEEAIQKVTDKYIADVDKHLESKEADLMAI